MAFPKVWMKYISGFVSTFDALSTWHCPAVAPSKIPEELLKPIDCGTFLDDAKHIRGDFDRALNKRQEGAHQER